MTPDTCGAVAHLPSYGTRTCTLPAGHHPPPDTSPTSTDGIRWATAEALAALQAHAGRA